IGLSALLVSTSKQMPLAVKELHRAGLNFPVIIGGAAINRAYAQRTLFVDGAEPYQPGVFYAKDAFEGLSLMDQLIDPARRATLVDTTIEGARRAAAKPGREAFAVPDEASETTRSATPLAEPPMPPFWGVREMSGIDLRDVWPHLDLKTLFRLHWGGKGVKDDAWESLQNDEFLPRLERMQQEAVAEGWLRPRVRYGYFPANADGNDLVVFDPVEQDREIARFAFPRQPRRDRLCLADYYLPLASGKRDVAAFQIVTMGEGATQRTERLQAAGEYAEAFFSHGLSVQSAEGLAEYTHQFIRNELGMGPEQGKRYSWGYPSCPDLKQHLLVDGLLNMGAIGVTVTDGYQFEPEQTTAALVVTHPDARYFALALTGGED
ncbi:MAG: vitamin B12 dependent-methionine synthase activation domain-containing protein, partial [Thermomicrobiales bacterium]